MPAGRDIEVPEVVDRPVVANTAAQEHRLVDPPAVDRDRQRVGREAALALDALAHVLRPERELLFGQRAALLDPLRPRAP